MHRVGESQVAMGVLVHHSFPDEEELANGVAVLTNSFTAYSTNITGDLVTQLGAESVTNPDGSSVPEIVSGRRYNSSYTLTLKQYSSLVPLGDYVMAWAGGLPRLLGSLHQGWLRLPSVLSDQEQLLPGLRV